MRSQIREERWRVCQHLALAHMAEEAGGGGGGAAVSTQQGLCSTLSWPSSSKSEEELTEAEERWVGTVGPSAEFSLEGTVSSVPFLLGHPGTPS